MKATASKRSKQPHSLGGVALGANGKASLNGFDGIRFNIDFDTVNPPLYTCHYVSGKSGLKGTVTGSGDLNLKFSGTLTDKGVKDCPKAKVETGFFAGSSPGAGLIEGYVA